MKETIKTYVASEIERLNNMMANSLTDEEKAIVQAHIDNLQSLADKIDEAEEAGKSSEELVNAIEEMNKTIEALREKVELNAADNKDKDKEDEMVENYLSTKNAYSDFANVIRTSKNSAEFKENWGAKLVENGFTITEGSECAFLPEAVKSEITDLWDRNAGWLKDLNNTGAKKYYIRHNTSDQNAETSRAKGWKKGDTKVGQSINFAAKLVDAQFIYKIQEIDLQTRFESDEALISYVLGELVDQILYEIKRAILVGDGRDDASDYKISKFETLAKDTTDAYTIVSTCESNFLVDDMRAMVDGIHNPNNKPVTVFMSKADLRTLSRVQGSETSTPVYVSTEQVCEQIGCSRIITTDLLGADYKAIAFIPNEYVLVGEGPLSPVLYSWHEGYKNLDVYRYECVAGGAIKGLKSSAVLLPAGN